VKKFLNDGCLATGEGTTEIGKRKREIAEKEMKKYEC